jgi:ABC-type transport system substrate-binding protein
VRFDRPDPEFPRLIATAFCGIVKAGSDLKPKQPLDGHLVGAGPFALDQAEPGFRYRFSANKGFQRGNRLGSLEIKILDNEQEVIRQAQAGAINLLRLRGNQLREVAVRDGSTLRTRPNFGGSRLERFPGRDLVYLRVNWQAEGLRDIPVKERREWLKAIKARINTKKLVESLYVSAASVAATPVESLALPPAAPPTDNSSAAIAGRNFELVTATVGELRQVSDAVASDLRQAGLTVDVRPLPIGDFVQRLFGGKYQVALLWLESNISPSQLSWVTFFSADNPISALAQPLPEVAERLDAARSAADEATRRAELARLLDEINARQDAIIPLVHREAMYLVGNEIGNPGVDANGILQFSLVEAR